MARDKKMVLSVQIGGALLRLLADHPNDFLATLRRAKVLGRTISYAQARMHMQAARAVQAWTRMSAFLEATAVPKTQD